MKFLFRLGIPLVEMVVAGLGSPGRLVHLLGMLSFAVVAGAATVATPTFSPVAGTYTGTQSVTIATTTSGASIRYTTNGTTPSSTVGTVYSGPVSIAATATLKAIAYKSGLTNSTVTSGTYTILAAAPTFSPVAGAYTGTQLVTIATMTSGASIRYTTDGSTPSSTVGTVYSSQVSIAATTTLKAIAYKSGLTNSTVTSGTYTIQAAAPTFNPVAGSYPSTQLVAIATTTSGASIRYTTDGSTPSSTVGTVYSSQVSIAATTTLKAIAYKSGLTSSTVTTGLYTISAKPVITSAITATGQVGVAFSYQITATNSPTSFSATPLPAGLSVNTATGLISGTPTATGATSVSLTATNTGGTSTAVTLTITVNPAKPVITSATTATGQVGVAFSYQITASNSPTSYTASPLPAGLTVNTTTGLISGTPTATGATSVSLTATNAGGSSTPMTLTITINPAKPVITSATTATGQVGAAFSYQITASNSPTSYAASPLPAGVTVNTTTGLISGTPTATGATSVTLTATNAGGSSIAVTLTITVNPANPVITSAITATGQVGVAFSYQTTASNSPTSYAAGPLPAGVTVNTTTGLISGTPTTTGATSVSLTATNAGGTSTAVILTLTINPAIPVISSSTTASGERGAIFSYQVTASNSPTSYSATGLPAGLSINSSTGLISGTPTVPGIYTVTIGATNPGGTALPLTLTITILAALPYTTDFESAEGYILGSLNGQLGWTVNTGASVVSNLDFANASQSVQLAPGNPPSAIGQTFASSPGETVEYFDIFAKPVAGTPPGTASTFSIDESEFAFQLSGNQGVLQAFSGNGSGGGNWMPTSFAIPLGAGNKATNWVRLTTRLDFGQQKWDLYANSQMVAADLPFINSSTYLSNFQLQGDVASSSGLDYIYAGPANPLFADTNNNGIDDTWETTYGLSLASNNRNTSPSGNGITVVQAYVTGTNPNDFYNGTVPTLTILDGNNQTGYAAQFNAQPFLVLLKNTAGTAPLANAPVTFTVQSGGGKLALTGTGTPALSDTLSLSTDANGNAQVYFRQPPAAPIQSLVTVVAGAAQNTFTSTSAFPGVMDSNGLPFAWEMQYFSQIGVDANADPDSDGLSTIQEYQAGTNPTNSDTDADGIVDGTEILLGTNPLVADVAQVPSLIAGKRLWLKADAISTAGPVAVWSDQSGNGNDAQQSSPNNRPMMVPNTLNGLPAVRFESAKRQSFTLPNLMNILTVATAGDIFVVIKSTAPAGTANALWAFTAYYAENFFGNIQKYPLNSWYPHSSGAISDYFGSEANYSFSPNVPLGRFNLYNVSTQTDSWIARLNGVTSFSSTTNNVVWTDPSPLLGARAGTYDDPGSSFAGDMAEVMIFDRVLSAGERSAINSYLIQKYNLGASDAVAPSAPTNLVVSEVTTGTITVSWTESSDNVAVTGYDIYKDGVVVESTTGTTCTVTGLSSDTTYSLTVKAKDAAGNLSAASAALTVPTVDTIAPSAPTLFKTTGITATDIALSWKLSTDNYGVVGYTVYQDGIPTTTTATTAANLTGLTGSTTYSITVKARDAAGNLSPDSTALSVRTASAAPTGLVASNITSRSIILSWNAAPANAGVVTYDIYQDGVWVGSSNTSSEELTNLAANTAYLLIVKVNDDLGLTSLPSAALSVTTTPPDLVAPSAPGGLATTYVSPTTAALSWTASTDNVAVIGYAIYQDSILVGRPTGTTFVATGLIPGSTYSITVKAEDGAGNLSAASSTLPVTTPSSTPTLSAAGLRLYLAADTLSVTDGSRVNVWPDQSGLGHNASQATVTQRPVYVANQLNGRPVLRFNNAEQRTMDLPDVMAGATAGEVFAVVKTTGLELGGGLWSWNGPAGKSQYPAVGNSITDAFGTNEQKSFGTVAADLTQYHMYNVSAQTGDWQARINGRTIFQSFSNTVAFATSVRIGSDYDYGWGWGTHGLDGDIAEVLVYDHVLSSSEREAVGVYVANKYALFAAPEAVTGLNATALNREQINLVWTGSNRSDQVVYEVERKSGTDNFAKIAETTGNGYTDTGLAAATACTYRVRMRALSGIGAYSTETSASTLAQGFLAMPNAGLRLWLSADTVDVTDGSRVNVWPDQSGLGNNASQATVTQRPVYVANQLNGRPVLRFSNAEARMMQLPDVMAGVNAGEAFVVVKTTTSAATGGLWSWNAPVGQSRYSTPDNSITDTFGSTWQMSLGVVAQDRKQYHIYNVSAQTGDWQARINGRMVFQSSTNTVEFSPSPWIGADLSYGYGWYTNGLDGDIAEVLVYDHVLRGSEREAVGMYMANKYALFAAPAAVAGLNATAVSHDQISLVWIGNNRTDQVVYEIERKSGAGSYVKIAETTGNGFTDSGRTAVTAYNYRVRMRALTGLGGYSPEATATTLGAGASPLPNAGMKLWLSADAVNATDGKRVNVWPDQSGLGNNATQSIVAQQPVLVANQLNGRPVLRFSNAEARMMNLPDVMAGATAGEAFAVVKTAASAATGGLWSWNAPVGQSRYSTPDNSITDTFGSTSQMSLGVVAQDRKQYHLYNVSAQTGNWQARINGRMIFQSNSNTVAFTEAPWIGADLSYGYGWYTNGLDGDIAEVLVYDHVLSVTEREAVGAYMANKYSLYATPVAVTGLSAIALSGTQAGLVWDVISRPDRVNYEIERMTGTGAYAKIAETEANTYFDTGLTPLTNFTYRVRVRVLTGSGAYSDEAIVTTLAANSSEVPTTNMRLWLKADAISSAGPVDLWPDHSGSGNDARQWSFANRPVMVPNGLNGRPVVRFEAAKGQTFNLPDLMNSPTVAAAGDIFVVLKSAAPAGTTNAVWAFTAEYMENFFGNMEKLPRSTSYPDASGSVTEYFGTNAYHSVIPTVDLSKFNLYNVSAQSGSWIARFNGTTNLSTANNTVAWTDHSPLLGGQGGTYYDAPIYFSGDIAEMMIFDRVLNAGERSALNAYLAQKYNLGSGDTAAPTAPNGLAATAVTTTLIAVSWTASSDNVGVTGYDIYNNGVVAGTTTGTSYTITGLNSDTTYNITVKAKDAAGNLSTASAALAVPTVDTIAPSAPTLFKTTGITATDIALSWKLSTDNYGVVGYNIYRDGALATTTVGTTGSISGLTGGMVYNITVKARDAAGNLSGASAVLSVRTAPAAPTGLIASNITSLSFVFSWTAAPANSGVVVYDVYQDGAWVASTGNPTCVRSGLTPGTTYSITVKANDDVGLVSLSSAALSVTTAPPDLVAPSVPGGLGTTNVSPTMAALSWTASTDNVTVIGYAVYQDSILVGRLTGTTFVVTGLIPGNTYSLTVKAEDGAGNLSDASSALAVTTPASTPALSAAGLRLYLAADTLSVTDGSRVNVWPDQSGLGNNASQATVTQQPVYVANQLNGRPVLRFSNAEARTMNLPDVMAGATAGEVFVVLKTATSAATGGLWSWNAPVGQSRYSTPDNSITDTFGTTEQKSLGTVAADLTQYHMYSVSAQTGDWQARINGRTVFQSASNTVAFATSVRIGSDYDYGWGWGTHSLDGDIAEVLVYDHVLSVSEREAVGMYVANKYALFAAPEAVTGLSTTALSHDQISLVWTGNSRTDQVVYEVERKSGTGTYAKIAETTGNGYTDTGLMPASAYTYRVRMRALSGIGAYSTETVGSTLGQGSLAMPNAGLRLWLSADTLSMTDGSRVNVWPDQSGLGNNASQAAVTQRPVFVANQLNGRPVLRFSNAEARTMNLPGVMAGATAGEVFVVLKTATSAATGGLWSWNAPVGQSRYSTQDNSITDTFGTTEQKSLGTVAADLTQYHMYSVSAQTGDWQARINGRTIFQSFSNTVAFATSVRIGSDYDYGWGWGTHSLDGDIAEVLVYDRVLSVTEREAVGMYMGNKYALFAAPAVVAGLNATALSHDQISLVWTGNNRTDQVVYEIERKSGAGSYVKIAETSGNGFTDTGLTAVTDYNYRVRMRAFTGLGGYSPAATATTLGAGASSLPNAGMKLWLSADAVSAGDGARVVVWPDRSGLGNNATQSTVTQRPVFVANQLNGRPVLRFSNAEARTMNLPDVMAGATAGEAFVVLKTTGLEAGGGLWSWNGPAGKSQYPAGGNSITDTFGTNAQKSFGTVAADLTQYHMYNVSAQTGDWQARINGRTVFQSASNTVAFATSIRIGSDYDYGWGWGTHSLDGDIAEVLVYDHVLSTAEREAVGAYMATKYALFSAPTQVTGLTGTSLSSTQVSLLWTSAGSRPDPVVYEIERRNGAGSFAKIGETAGIGFTDTGLTDSTAYTYRVRMRTMAGLGDYSAEASVTTLAPSETISGLRLWLKAETLEAAGAVSSWTDQSGKGNHATQASAGNRPTIIANAINGLPAVRFDAAQSQYLNLPDLMNSPAAVAGDIFVVLKLPVTGTPGGPLWSLQAYPSDPNYPTIEDTLPCNYGQNQLSVYFGSNESHDFGPSTDLSKFNVFNVSAEAGSWIARLNFAPQFAATDSPIAWTSRYPMIGAGGWANYRQYFSGDVAEILLYDHALSASERSTINNYLNQKYALGLTNDIAAPSTPINLSTSQVTGNSFLVTWAAALDNIAVAGYDIYRDGVLVGSTIGTSYVVTGLTNNVAYTITVKARDAVGNVSALSTAVSRTTVDTVTPSAPTGLITSNISPGNVTLSWTPSTDDVGVAEYDIYYSLLNPDGTPWFTTLSASTANTTHVFTNMSTSGQSFYFSVKARDAAGHVSAESTRIHVSIPSFGTSPVNGILAAGNNTSAAVSANGSFYSWGLNNVGQLGQGNTTSYSVPRYDSNDGLCAIAFGDNHMLMLNIDGTIMSSGSNANGQLGDGTTTQNNSGTYFNAPVGMLAIAAGSAHSLALNYDGTVWACGLNTNGQLGDGTTTQRTTAVQVPGLTGIIAIAAKASHSLALKSDGTVWAWGLNTNGQLGDGTTTQRTSPVQIPALTGVASIAAGQHFSFAVKSDGSAWAWGLNTGGQLGDGTTTQRTSPVAIPSFAGVKTISAGASHSVALKTDGTVWTWGLNTRGQLGDASTQRSAPAQLASINGVVAVAAGQVHTLILKSDGAIIALGDNTNGELGDGVSTNMKLVPRPAGAWSDTLSAALGTSHGLAVRSDHSLWVWGLNASGQLGDGTTANRDQPVQISTPVYNKVAAGDSHSLALGVDGTAWSFGLNANGQLGNNSTTQSTVPVQVKLLTPTTTTLSSITEISAGVSHSIALKSDGTVWSWGLNTNGQLGDNSTTQRLGAVQVKQIVGTTVSNLIGVTAIASGTGASHNLALKSDGTVWSWGWNNRGQLGQGNTTQLTTAKQITSLTEVVAIAVGTSHSLAVKSDGTVWAWGYNSSGQLGDSSNTQRTTPIQVTALAGNSIVSVAAGAAHSLALTADGNRVYAWGLNSSGQLGNQSTSNRNSPSSAHNLVSVDKVVAGGATSLAICTDKSLRLWGSNASGQLGAPVISNSLAGLRLIPSTIDADSDGVPDSWEMIKFNRTDNYVSSTDDYDDDGLTNIQEYILGTDPTQADGDGDGLTDPVDLTPADYFNGITPVVAIVSGNNQTGQVHQFNALPLKISVMNAAGTAPLANAPVNFQVTTGGGQISENGDGTPILSNTISVRTAADGTALVYFKQPMFTAVASQIRVVSGGVSVVIHTTSVSGPDDTDNDNLLDTWEISKFGNLGQTATGDPDNDGLTNLEEYLANTNPTQLPDPNTPALVNLSVWTPLQ